MINQRARGGGRRAVLPKVRSSAIPRASYGPVVQQLLSRVENKRAQRVLQQLPRFYRPR